MEGKPEGFAIMVPQSEIWSMLIEECFPDARRVTRYCFSF
ncbi:GNAT family N-acetyltransferase [Roseburia sp. OF03-24]|nr:GNAT family N-acetyltransferase [Roseburia sp. OF03-24]